jgi:hypothetical protein
MYENRKGNRKINIITSVDPGSVGGNLSGSASFCLYSCSG